MRCYITLKDNRLESGELCIICEDVQMYTRDIHFTVKPSILAISEIWLAGVACGVFNDLIRLTEGKWEVVVDINLLAKISYCGE